MNRNVQDLLELDDITLIPSPINNGWRDVQNMNYLVRDLISRSLPNSLPLFTSPMDSIVSSSNWGLWQKSKINPIIPRTESIETRLDLSREVFTAFSFNEVKQLFLDQDRRYQQQQFRVCLDIGNGHDSWVFELGQRLKSIYGQQIILMGGNIENPETYVNYSKSGFDFVRLGMTSGSLVMREKFGYRYPMASLLLDTSAVRAKAKSAGIRPINIISDGGVRSMSDIVKLIALGADYVMVGREFARILEAAGRVFNRKKTSEGIDSVEEILRSTDLTEKELKDLELTRLYSGNTTIETQLSRGGYSDPTELVNPKIVDSRSAWVSVNRRLEVWLDDFKEIIRYSFMMSNSKNWDEFKNNVKYGKI